MQEVVGYRAPATRLPTDRAAEPDGEREAEFDFVLVERASVGSQSLRIELPAPR